MKYTQTDVKNTTPVFDYKQKQLQAILKDYSVEQLHDVMKISFKTANTVYQYFHQEQLLYPALYQYSGTVFSKLKLHTYKEIEQLYLDQYVRILSAYYGVLKYSDGISSYRLDMTMKIKDTNLYSFWKKEVHEYFKDDDFIISLASKEFSMMIDHPTMIHIDFVEDKAGKITRNAMYIKQARGMMLHHLIIHSITTIEEIKKITFDRYCYNEELSSPTTLVFYRTMHS